MCEKVLLFGGGVGRFLLVVMHVLRFVGNTLFKCFIVVRIYFSLERVAILL